MQAVAVVDCFGNPPGEHQLPAGRSPEDVEFMCRWIVVVSEPDALRSRAELVALLPVGPAAERLRGWVLPFRERGASAFVGKCFIPFGSGGQQDTYRFDANDRPPLSLSPDFCGYPALVRASRTGSIVAHAARITDDDRWVAFGADPRHDERLPTED